jgi:hypothetical protein
MVANRTRERRLSGMKRGAYGDTYRGNAETAKPWPTVARAVSLSRPWADLNVGPIRTGGASNLAGRSDCVNQVASKITSRVKRIADFWECRAALLTAKVTPTSLIWN